MSKATINNEIILLRKNVVQARVQIIKKLLRDAKKLREKKGTDQQKAKNGRKAERIAAEMFAIKKVKKDEITKYILTNTLNLKEILENQQSEALTRMMARIANHKTFSKKISEFKTKYPNYMEFLGPGRKKKALLERKEKKKLRMAENGESVVSSTNGKVEDGNSDSEASEKNDESSDDESDVNNEPSVSEDEKDITDEVLLNTVKQIESEDSDEENVKSTKTKKVKKSVEIRGTGVDNVKVSKSKKLKKKIDVKDEDLEISEPKKIKKDVEIQDKEVDNTKISKPTKLKKKIDIKDEVEISEPKKIKKDVDIQDEEVDNTKISKPKKLKKKIDIKDEDVEISKPKKIKKEAKIKDEDDVKSTEVVKTELVENGTVKKEKAKKRKKASKEGGDQTTDKDIKPEVKKKKSDTSKIISKQAIVKKFNDIIQEEDVNSNRDEEIRTDTAKSNLKLKIEKEEDPFFVTGDGGQSYLSVALPKNKLIEEEEEYNGNDRFNKRTFSRQQNDKFFSKVGKFQNNDSKFNSNRPDSRWEGQRNNARPYGNDRSGNSGRERPGNFGRDRSGNKPEFNKFNDKPNKFKNERNDRSKPYDRPSKGKFEDKGNEVLHPSWEAKKKQQDILKQGFQGKKIVFGDDM